MVNFPDNSSQSNVATMATPINVCSLEEGDANEPLIASPNKNLLGLMAIDSLEKNPG